MDPITRELKEYLEDYFGERAIFLLSGELKDLGFSDVMSLDSEERKELADALVEDLFSQMVSPSHLRQVQHRLCKILNIEREEDPYFSG
ncbi:hypothetical protein JXB02_05865 [Candidatus Woesearchaeota archaeon]|nr:hypothetical protein [Candidatus Woesearchaeota archaeon]